MYIRISYLVLFCCLVNKSYPTLLWSPWTVAYQAPLSMGFPRPEYWNGLPFPPPGDLPDPKMELTSPVTPELAGGFFTTEPTGKPSLCFSQSVSSVTQSCPTLCDPMNCSTPGLPMTNSWSSLKLINQVGDAIQPSHPLSSPSPPAPNSSQHQGLFQWVNSLHEVTKVLEFQL